MSELLSVLSSLTMVVFVAVYMRQLIAGVSTPNPATWIIWCAVMLINTLTYYFVTRENIWLILTPAVITSGLLLILAYSFMMGQFGGIGALEIIVLSLAAASGVCWIVTKNPVMANLTMQAVLLVSFVPTLSGLLKGELKEVTASWNWAVLSYLLLIASILCHPNWTWVQLAYPFFNGIVGNGSVVIAARLQRSRQGSRPLQAAPRADPYVRR